MADAPRLTIHLGPQTALGRALNNCARIARKTPRSDGRLILPNRKAHRMTRHLLISPDALEVRQAAFRDAFDNDGEPVYLSFLHALSAPQTAFQNNELFPDVEVTLARLSALLDGADLQIVVTLDALHRFFLAAASDALDARLRTTPWDALYELSWAELMEEIRRAFPNTPILILTGSSAARCSEALLRRFFGDEFVTTVDANVLLEIALNEKGQDKLRALPNVSQSEAELLLESFPAQPEPAELRQRIGIDLVTADLLDQRFASDMAVIERIDGVSVP